MAFRPEILLSKEARARCIANLKELPSLLLQNPSEKKLAAVLVPLCVDNGEVCLLYTLRSSNLSTHSGQVCFPGGKKNPNENPVETALRETEEEIGFPKEQVDVWAKMGTVQGRDKTIRIKPVVGVLKNFNRESIIHNSDEVEEVFTVSLESLCDTNNHAHFMFNNYPLPVYLCGNHRVWGITGIITHMFLQSFLPNHYKPNFLRKSYKLDELLPSKL